MQSNGTFYKIIGFYITFVNMKYTALLLVAIATVFASCVKDDETNTPVIKNVQVRYVANFDGPHAIVLDADSEYAYLRDTVFNAASFDTTITTRVNTSELLSIYAWIGSSTNHATLEIYVDGSYIDEYEYIRSQNPGDDEDRNIGLTHLYTVH